MNEFVVNYIKNMTDTICIKFNGVRIRYAFEELTNFHIIEIESFFEKDEAIMIELKKMIHSYRVQIRKTFPNENIILGNQQKFHDMNNLLYNKESLNLARYNSKDYTFIQHPEWLDVSESNFDEYLIAA